MEIMINLNLKLTAIYDINEFKLSNSINCLKIRNSKNSLKL